jgi:hypothetical protein
MPGASAARALAAASVADSATAVDAAVSAFSHDFFIVFLLVDVVGEKPAFCALPSA